VSIGRTVKGNRWGPRWLLWKVAAGMAMQADRRMSWGELRGWGDSLTDGELSDYELDKVVRLVKEHPAYQAIPGEDPEEPPSPAGDL